MSVQGDLAAAPIQHNASRQEEYCSHTEQMLSFEAERIEQMSEATEQCEALQRRMAAAVLQFVRSKGSMGEGVHDGAVEIPFARQMLCPAPCASRDVH